MLVTLLNAFSSASEEPLFSLPIPSPSPPPSSFSPPLLLPFPSPSLLSASPSPLHLHVRAAANIAQRKALEETKVMLPRLRQDIQDALSKLESQLVCIPATVSLPVDLLSS